MSLELSVKEALLSSAYHIRMEEQAALSRGDHGFPNDPLLGRSIEPRIPLSLKCLPFDQLGSILQDNREKGGIEKVIFAPGCYDPEIHRERIEYFMKVYSKERIRDEKAIIIPMGGFPLEEERVSTEAERMQERLLLEGYDPSRIFAEYKSLDSVAQALIISLFYTKLAEDFRNNIEIVTGTEHSLKLCYMIKEMCGWVVPDTSLHNVLGRDSLLEQSPVSEYFDRQFGNFPKSPQMYLWAIPDMHELYGAITNEEEFTRVMEKRAHPKYRALKPREISEIVPPWLRDSYFIFHSFSQKKRI